MSCDRRATIRNRKLASSIFHQTNLEQVLLLASPDDWADGIGWYSAAHGEALRLSAEHAVTLRQSAGIIAALSPQTRWEENLRIADLFLTDQTQSHYDNAHNKAVRILHGEDPGVVLRGNKVRSFFANILRPGVAGPVTVDRHAVAILLGVRTPDYNTGPYRKVLDRTHVYRLASAHYRHAARLYGVLPHELQAVAWLAQRSQVNKERTIHVDF